MVRRRRTPGAAVIAHWSPVYYDPNDRAADQGVIAGPPGSEVIVHVKRGKVLVKVRATSETRPSPEEIGHRRADPRGHRVFDRGSSRALHR